MSTKIKQAIISVSQKTALVPFAQRLNKSGVTIVATGGTASQLKQAGIPVKQVSQLTNSPEIFGGRVKTLHPAIFGGILFKRDDPGQSAEAEKEGIIPIDMVVCNLYPFAERVVPGETPIEEAVELIDIGGHSLLRAAAKNMAHVLVVTDPGDYESVAEAIEAGKITDELKHHLACKAWAHVAEYDMVIAQRMSDILKPADQEDPTPEFTGVVLQKISSLRYGENPHQSAAWYCQSPASEIPGLPQSKQLGGKELSYNNLLDLNGAIEMARDFPEPTAAVLKHNNPCGLASGNDIAEAYRLAHECDPLSAYGCIIGVNRIIDMKAAEEIHNTGFVEALIAPGYEPEALNLLLTKKQRRILELPGLDRSISRPQWSLRMITGGALLQQIDMLPVSEYKLEVVTKMQPTPDQMKSLIFAFRASKHVKSNAIVLVQGTATVGIGAGQMSRVDSAEIAVSKAGDRAKGSVLGSDAFFPFADGVEKAAEAGISAIIQPGGSKRDDEVIEACDRLGIPMVFTGFRHFRH